MFRKRHFLFRIFKAKIFGVHGVDKRAFPNILIPFFVKKDFETRKWGQFNLAIKKESMSGKNEPLCKST